MPIWPYSREVLIQRSKGKQHTMLWAVQLVSCQLLSCMEQATLQCILSTETRSCNNGCRQIILLRATPTMRALIVQRVPKMGRYRVVTRILCTLGTTAMETGYRNTGSSTVWDMPSREEVAMVPILIHKDQVQLRQSI